MTDVPSKKDRARRRGSLFGIVVFALIVTAFTAVCSIEIIIQAWARPAGAAGSTTGTKPLLPESR